jgi:hypothetical protein
VLCQVDETENSYVIVSPIYFQDEGCPALRHPGAELLGEVRVGRGRHLRNRVGGARFDRHRPPCCAEDGLFDGPGQIGLFVALQQHILEGRALHTVKRCRWQEQ